MPKHNPMSRKRINREKHCYQGRQQQEQQAPPNSGFLRPETGNTKEAPGTVGIGMEGFDSKTKMPQLFGEVDKQLRCG